MTKPILVDSNIYNKIKRGIINKNHSEFSFKVNIGIILGIILIGFFIYYIYLEKNREK